MLSSLLKFKQVFSPLYFNIQLDITNSCNLRCVHCYHSHHSNAGALSSEQWLSVILKIKKFLSYYRATPRFFICGGEPTLAPGFEAILQSIINEFGPSSFISILSNGTRLDSPLLMEANKIQQPVKTVLSLLESIQNEAKLHVQLSLDGPDAHSHNLIRGNGSFEKTIRNLKKLIEKNISVSLQAVLTRLNAEKIDDFFYLANELQVSSMDFVRLVEEGHAVHFVKEYSDKTPHLYGEELKLAMEKILECSIKYNVSTNTTGPLWALIDSKLGSASRLGFNDVIVDYQGNLKISSRTSFKIGNILKLEPSDLVNLYETHPILNNLKRGRIEGCGECELLKKNLCSGDRNVAFAGAGNFLAPDYGCWKWRGENAIKIRNSKNFIQQWLSNAGTGSYTFSKRGIVHE